VFISYRREETAWQAGWLFDRLADRFGRGQIFKDVDSIELGDDFVEVITTAVGSCDVLLALIGEHWITITDEHGTARLDNPDDFVRLEIEAALTRNVRVIPILVDGARMPRPDQLPPSLAKLARRQALELSPSHFEFDTSRLHRVLDRALAEVHAQPTITEPDAAVATRQAQLRALYVEARAESRLGHFQTAIALLDDLLALDPSRRDAAQLRATASHQLHLADTYQRALDAEAASEWTHAANAYTEILDVDATYRDAAARRDACQARQQLIDLQGELRGHAATGQWQAVLDTNAELGRLDPAATDPDGLATQAQHAIDNKKRAEEQARRDAEEQARRDAEEQARRDAEEQARRDAEEQARRDAEEQARQDAEEQARQDAEEQARRDAEEQARQDAEEQARRDAEEQARQDAEVQVQPEAQRKARLRTRRSVAILLASLGVGIVVVLVFYLTSAKPTDPLLSQIPGELRSSCTHAGTTSANCRLDDGTLATYTLFSTADDARTDVQGHFALDNTCLRPTPGNPFVVCKYTSGLVKFGYISNHGSPFYQVKWSPDGKPVTGVYSTPDWQNLLTNWNKLASVG
jgi:hypothetical protein